MIPIEQFSNLSLDNWRQRAVAAGVLGVVGLSVELAIQIADPFMAPVSDGVMLVLAFLGAGLAGALLSDGFGRLGRSGWLTAVLTAVAATVGGGALAATLLWPGMGTVTGAVYVWTLANQHVLVAFVWIMAMVAAHLGLQRVRLRRVSR